MNAMAMEELFLEYTLVCPDEGYKGATLEDLHNFAKAGTAHIYRRLSEIERAAFSAGYQAAMERMKGVVEVQDGC